MALRPRSTALGLAVLLIAAGCLGSPGSPRTPGTTTPGAVGSAGTTTPGAVGSEGTDGSAVVRPPGVDNGTLRNASALVAAHRSALSGAGFVAREANGARATRYAVEPGFAAYRVAPDEGSDRPAVWANATVTLARDRRGNETVYHRPPRGWASPGLLTGARRLQRLLAVGTYVATGVDACGDATCVVLRTDGGGGDRFENATGVARVDAAGVVRSFRFAYDRRANGRTERVSYRLSVVRLGDVSVERPPWVDDALDRT